MEKKLQRDENSKMIGGVAAGLAEYFDVDVTWVRLAFILAVLAGFSGVLAYIILWIAVPAKPFNPFGPGPSSHTADYRVYEDRAPFTAAPHTEFKAAFKEQAKKDDKGRLIAGVILVSLGTIFLIHQLDLLPHWFSFGKLWPLALIVPGVLMLIRSTETKRPVVSQEAPLPKEEEQPASTNINDNTQNTDI